MSHPSHLNRTTRAAALTELRDGEPLDVLVVGGGVTGAGAALDAASRGLRTALVERRDLAHGTSRWSAKLVHGGLRYLASGAVGIAMESARERGVLLERTAPHLVRPIRQVVPLTPGVPRSVERRSAVGLHLGDGLRRAAGTPARELPRVHRADPAEMLEIAPGVRRDRLRGGLVAWDAQLEDDARLVVGLARTAAAHGAHIATRCGVVEAAPGGAKVRDELTGETFDVRARTVINATGVWAGELDPALHMRPSRGSHLVVSLRSLGGLAGILSVPVPGDASRFVFAIPQRSGLAYVGITDEPITGALPEVPDAPATDVAFLLETISGALEVPLTDADVLGTYAGLRPLVDGAPGTRTADLSREHLVLRGPGGLVSVVGGKLTTYRRMAQDAIDATGLTDRPCRTRDLPLLGAAPREALARVEGPERLVRRFGTEAPTVLAEAVRVTGLAEAELVAPGPGGVTLAELVFGVTHEGAADVDDLLDRRTRVGLVTADRDAALPLAVRALELAAAPA